MKPSCPPGSGAEPVALVGCGILRREVDALIARHGWAVEPTYFDSSLHNYLNRLQERLEQALEAGEAQGRPMVVLYGACHPRMEGILAQHHLTRTQGQNCIVQLLGYDVFMEKLGEGAYFLLEDWAHQWEPMITAAFGSRLEVVRAIFQSSHSHLVAIRTPCSGDFTLAAEAAARFVGLPLQWLEADLGHLEGVLSEALAGPLGGPGKPRP